MTSEVALLRSASLGDRDAFDAIVDRHAPAMLRYASRLLDNPADAEDAVQDALVSAWRGLDTFRGESSLRTWLLTLTSRRAVDVLRKRGALAPAATDPADLAASIDGDSGRAADVGSTVVDPYRQMATNELVAALDRALGALPWRQRAVWLLREVEELSYEQIARVLATRPTVVRGQLARARTNLAERMAPWR